MNDGDILLLKESEIIDLLTGREPELMDVVVAAYLRTRAPPVHATLAVSLISR